MPLILQEEELGHLQLSFSENNTYTNIFMTFGIFFQIIGSLALLIYGMKIMSEALQKMAGDIFLER